MEVEVKSHLTKKQRELLSPVLLQFREECKRGRPGSVILQVDNDLKGVRGCYVSHKKTTRIMKILNEEGSPAQDHYDVSAKKKELAKGIAVALHDYMEKLKRPKTLFREDEDWVRSPGEFLPANVCCDKVGRSVFLKGLAKVVMETLESVYIVLDGKE